jgi:protein-tyrosine-phosphatase
VCRSPYLEAVLQRALPDIRVTSAGFLRAGRRVPESLISASAERGIDLSGFRSRPLEPRRVRDIELVVAMDSFQAHHLMRYLRVPPERVIVAGDLDPVPGSTRAIQDPYQQPVNVLLSALDRLDRCAATLVATVRPADPR